MGSRISGRDRDRILAVPWLTTRAPASFLPSLERCFELCPHGTELRKGRVMRDQIMALSGPRTLGLQDEALRSRKDSPALDHPSQIGFLFIVSLSHSALHRSSIFVSFQRRDENRTLRPSMQTDDCVSWSDLGPCHCLPRAQVQICGKYASPRRELPQSRRNVQVSRKSQDLENVFFRSCFFHETHFSDSAALLHQASRALRLITIIVSMAQRANETVSCQCDPSPLLAVSTVLTCVTKLSDLCESTHRTTKSQQRRFQPFEFHHFFGSPRTLSQGQ
ncbi:uncharacterized protein BJX67DRAFT_315013 [Aspergillus lucknowensis]|uniref:Uncharacterized protein n=1 Tax=Aspergillus lucknowensis TaxID=176173 RepID=A0ABR4LAJ4_9EURO